MNSSLSKVKTFSVTNFKHLSYLLSAHIDEIDYLAKNANDFYYEKKELKFDKYGNVKRDSNGNVRVRIIHPSKANLKEIQKLIHRRILSKIYLPKNIKGSVKGEDNISNAKFHQGNKYKFATDLKEFFPSISHFQVMDMFLRNGFSKEVASLLTKLTTYKGAVPQGAPTSSSIANIVFLPIDFQLIKLCNKHKIKYSRYVDDLTFSSKNGIKKISLDFLKIITESGFRISHKKTFYTSGIAEITGVPVKNNSLGIADRINEKLKEKKLNPLQKEGLLRYRDRIIYTNLKKRKPTNFTKKLQCQKEKNQKRKE